MPWRTRSRAAVIVAESLRLAPDPPFATLPRGVAAPAAVAAAIARALAPPVAHDPPPAFLRPAQRVCFARALAALRRFNAALVAEPVGSGKTWIALALAQATGAPVVAIVPASLTEQWGQAARRAGVQLAIQTHEQWSRRPRPLPPGLVVIDESHRFRHPTIRRYLALAPALIGRAGVLLTATPAINSLTDVAHQLLLFARDDALAGAGVTSLLGCLDRGAAPAQLADLIIAGTTVEGRPRDRERGVPATAEEERLSREALVRLDRLRLSDDPGVRALLAGGFAAALASSPAALHAALQRYRALLLQSRDAVQAGQRLGRHELRRLLGPDAEQTVLWGVLAWPGGGAELLPEDLPAVEDCLAWAAGVGPARDPKIGRLRAVVASGERAIVFAGARATVDHVRRALNPLSRIAWCTGAAAGIGNSRMPRPEVLAWFAPAGPEHPLGPTVLVTTDVAAEGLDLQRAQRVVHYDLPWTAVRMDQRAGRAVRLGSLHAIVEVVTLLPPPALESRLQLVQRLARKRPLPGRVGLGRTPEPAWLWRASLADRWRAVSPEPGVAVVEGEEEAAMVAVRLDAGGQPLTTFVLTRCGRGGWTASDHGVVDALLRGAQRSEARSDPDEAHQVVESARRHIRTAVLGASGALWRVRPFTAITRPGLFRVRQVAADAVRRRDRAALALADRAIAFLRRGHTAGERLLAAELGGAQPARMAELLAGLPAPDPLPEPVQARIVGVIVARQPPTPPP